MLMGLGCVCMGGGDPEGFTAQLGGYFRSAVREMFVFLEFPMISR